MSAKIYTGFKFKTNDIHIAHKQIISFRDELFSFAQKLYYQVLVSEAVAAIDLHAAGMLEDRPVNPLSAASSVLEQQQRDIIQSGIRNPEFDFSFSISVFPIEDKNEKYLLGMFFCDNEDLIDFFDEQSYWESYTYHDGSDSLLQKIGQEQFELRKRHWDLALAPSFTPARNGLTIELIPIVNGDFFQFDSKQNPMDFVLSLGERSEVIAKEKIAREAFDIGQDTGMSMFAIMKLISNEENVSKMANEIRPKLKVVLELPDLIGQREEKSS